MSVYLQILPNPFLPHGVHTAVGTAAPANPVAPAAGAAAYPDAEHLRGLVNEAQAALDRMDADRFRLDPDAFMQEIEPVPAFLTRPIVEQVDEIEEMLELARGEEWPAPPQRRTA